MTKEEKIQIAKRLYEKLGIQTENVISNRIDEINADICMPSESQRGTSGIIIGDDGSYLVCGSIKPVESYIEDYKNGERSTMNNNENEIESKVQEFARENGYQKAIYLDEWNGYKCYEPIYDEDEHACIGLPLIILVDENGNIRMSTGDEGLKHMRETREE